jgi:hypothetical protein
MFHKRSFTLFFVLTIVSGCGDSETYSLKNISIGNAATGGGIAPVGLLGMSVSKMVDKFHEIASELMFEGENRGDAVLEMAGNRLDVAIQNANIIMSNQQNTLFNNLSVSEQSFFTQLNTVVSGALAPANKIVSILKQANLNLIDLTNRLPLTEKRYNFINQIEGLCQIHDAGNYRIRISGLGFGQDVDNASYVPAVKIGGKTVPQNFLSRIPPYTMEVVIPHDMLEPYFKKNQVASADLEIGMEANTSSSCALLFHCKNTIHSAWKPKLVLMPLVAGYITGEEVLSSQSLDGKTQTTSVTVQTPGGDQYWNRDINVAENQRILSVRYVCATGMCSWSYRGRTQGEGADYDILKNGTAATVYRHTQGPATIIHYADFQTLVDNTVLKKIDTIHIEYGKIITLPLSQDNKACAYRLSIVLSTGQSSYIDNSMTQSADKLISRIGMGSGQAGGTCQPVFMLSIP